MITLVTVPDYTTLAKNYGSPPTVTKWLKSNGEPVQAEEALVLIETTKASVEVEAPAAGLLFIVKQEQDTAKIGETLGVIAASAEEFAEFRSSR
jgi:pyruvate/2-oxoglutarate dehydrogenase complex dihydrolipoamide acyltransferase (E2) component